LKYKKKKSNFGTVKEYIFSSFSKIFDTASLLLSLLFSSLCERSEEKSKEAVESIIFNFQKIVIIIFFENQRFKNNI
jgi:hypothetical protein